MKIFVKVLGGDDCTIEAHENTTILEIKNQVEKHMKILAAQQTLVFHGKTLSDDKTVGFYPKIKDGSKLHLVMKKPETLEVALGRFLQKYYNEKQTKAIIDEFMKDFHNKVHSLSLEDLERIATSYLRDGNLHY